MTECGKKSSRTFQQVELVKDQDAHTSIRPGHTQAHILERRFTTLSGIQKVFKLWEARTPALDLKTNLPSYFL